MHLMNHSPRTLSVLRGTLTNQLWPPQTELLVPPACHWPSGLKRGLVYSGGTLHFRVFLGHGTPTAEWDLADTLSANFLHGAGTVPRQGFFSR